MPTLLNRLDNNNNSFSDDMILLPRSRINHASPTLSDDMILLPRSNINHASPTPLFLLPRSKLTALIPHRSYGTRGERSFCFFLPPPLHSNSRLGLKATAIYILQFSWIFKSLLICSLDHQHIKL